VNEWTIAKVIEWTTLHFNSKGIDSARLDGELLLSHTLKCKRIDLYLKFDQLVTQDELTAYKALVVRRSKREPIAYILGRQEFYDRSFCIHSGVLIPRPETEHLVEAALEWAKINENEKILALDIGCGSGAISVSLAAENAKFFLTALDISTVACETTKVNAEKNNVSKKIEIENADFQSWSSSKKFDLVVSNPPYVGENVASTLKADVINFEPREALFGGLIGDEKLKVWLPKMIEYINPEGLLLCEIGFDQENAAIKCCENSGTMERIEVLKDYSGHPRVLRAFRSVTNG
jgi:release factor glutamine methyltransferase